jgi:hypothetical protein
MIIETFEHKGHTVEIHVDMDGYSSNPRQNCNIGTFVGFKNRHYTIGDEEIDPNEITNDCACDGGEVTFPIMGVEVTRECSLCEGYGYRSISTFDDMVEYMRANYDVVGDVFPVSMIDHSGVSYSIGFPTDRWDGSNAGVIFATRKQIDETGCPLEMIPEGLKQEIAEYSAWANGEVYGFVIKDRNGDEVEDGSCWGLVGLDYAIEYAKEDVPDEQPPKLHTARLTDKTLDTLIAVLEMAADQGFPEPEVLSLIQEIRAKEDDDDDE